MTNFSSLEQIFLFIFVFFILLVISSLIGFFLRPLFERKTTKHRAKIVTMVLQYTLIILGTYFINNNYLGFDFKVFATSLGILTVAVAFSSQQIIQNFIAGLIISIKGPFVLDDWVEILPVAVIGKVREINLMRTNIRDISGKIHYIPNSLILNSRIINYTGSGFVEAQIPLQIPVAFDFDKAKKVILGVLNKNSNILPNVSRTEKKKISKLFELKYIKDLYPKRDLSKFHPTIIVTDISSGKITVSLRFWILEVNNRDKIVSELYTKLKEALEKEEIIL